VLLIPILTQLIVNHRRHQQRKQHRNRNSADYRDRHLALERRVAGDADRIAGLYTRRCAESRDLQVRRVGQRDTSSCQIGQRSGRVCRAGLSYPASGEITR